MNTLKKMDKTAIPISKGKFKIIDMSDGVVIQKDDTGMRKQEILSLKWKQIDLENGYIDLPDTKNNTSAKIPINETIKNVLSNIQRRLDIPFVFFNEITGQRQNEIHYSFRKALERAKITDFRFHDLRHTFGSYLAMNGVTLPALKQLMRHSDISMTMRYIHLMPSYTKDAVGKLDGIFERTLKKLESKAI